MIASRCFFIGDALKDVDLPVSLFLIMIKYVMSNEASTVIETAGSDVTGSRPFFYILSFVQFRQRSDAQPAKAY
jgi:hypothetical protein